MPPWINQNSFLITAAAATVILAAVLFRDGIRTSDLIALGALAAGLALAYFLLRPGPAATSESAQAEIGRGTPVLLEFQSPY